MQYLGLFSFLGLAVVATALPQGNPTMKTSPLGRSINPPPPCISTHHWVAQHVAPAPEPNPGKQVLGSVTCSAHTGSCSLSHSNSYSVAVGYTIGGGVSIDLEDIFDSAHLDASYTHTTTKGVVNTGTENCPKGDWTCGLLIVPYAKEVTGITYVSTTGPCVRGGSHIDQEPFTVHFPEINPSDHAPMVNVKVCVCPNLSHSGAGMPPLCPMAC